MSDVYKINYSQRIKENNNWTNVTKTIYTENNIYELNPLNSKWGNSGCYCGAIAENNSIIGSSSEVIWTGWKNDRVQSDLRDSQIVSSTYSKQQNLRFMAKYNNNGFVVGRQSFKWTGLGDEIDTIEEALRNKTNASIYDPYIRNNKNITNGGNSNSPFNVAPLNSLKINDLIWLPKFIFREVEYYNRNTDLDIDYYTSRDLTSNYTSCYWKDIKPEDKTPKGNLYDDTTCDYQEIFDKGFTEIEPVHGDGVRYKFCCGVVMIPYYGKSSMMYDGESYVESINPDDHKEYGYREILGSTITESGYYPEIGGNRPCLMVLSETYEQSINGVIYSVPTGLSFSNVSGLTIDPGDFALSQNWALTNNYQLFSSQRYWSTYFNTSNNNYCNYYKYQDPDATEQESPVLIVPSVKMDVSGDIISLINNDYPSSIHIENDNPCFCSYSRTNRIVNLAPICYYSINELWHTIASLGCYVADNILHAQCAMTGKWIGDNNHIYLGYMDINGITNGTMLQGSDISNSTQSNIDDIIQNTPYVPVNPEKEDDESDPDRDDINPPNREGDNIPIHLNNRFGLFNSFLTMYNLTESELSNFGSALLGNPLNYRGNFQKDLSQQLSGTYDVSSILNYIVSVKMYPFSVATLSDTTTQATNKVYMGTGEFGIPIGTPCRTLTSSISVLYAGSLFVAPKTPYKDFRDYYNTNIVCYMPYCGCVELNPMDIMNTTLECYYLIDFLTGDCTALLYSIGSNGLNYPVAIANGNIGIDIPLSATNTGQLEAVKRMQNAQTAHTVISYINAGIEAIQDVSDIKNNFSDVEDFNGFLNLVKPLVGDLSTIAGTYFENKANPYGGNRSARSAVAMPLMPTGSGATNFMLNNSVYLQIRRGTYSKPKNYAKTMGYPTTYSKQLREVHGLTFCSGVNVSGINCTQEEKEMIRSALEGGTILP